MASVRLGEPLAPGCQRHGCLPALSQALLWFLSPPLPGSPPRPQESAVPESTSKKERSFRKHTRLLILQSTPGSPAASGPSNFPVAAGRAHISALVRRLKKWPRRLRSPLEVEPELVSLGLALELFPSPRAPSPRCGKDWRASRSQRRICSLSPALYDPNFRHPPPNWVTRQERSWVITGVIIGTAVHISGSAPSTSHGQHHCHLHVQIRGN